jgi:hypothetical protein
MKVGRKMHQVGLEHTRNGHDLAQAAAHHGAMRLMEKARSPGGIRLVPRLYDLVFV